MTFLDVLGYDHDNPSSTVASLGHRLQRIEARMTGGDEDKRADWMTAAIKAAISSLAAHADQETATARARSAIATHWGEGVPFYFYELGMFPRPDEHVGQELTAKIFDRLAREALEVAERAVAAASAVERIDALAEQVWEVLREAPYGSFGDEPWDALQAAQSVADKAMTGPHLALEPPNDPHEHTEVFPLLAVALGALHAATHPGASINDRFSNWNCSEASSR